MKIKPIKNESHYDFALAEIDRLWGSAQGTPDGDRLDDLIAQVEKYDEAHHPICAAR